MFHSTRARLATVAAASVLGLAGVAAVATPALAAGGPPSGSGNVSVNATVQAAETLTLSGLSPTISLAGHAGTIATAPNAETYSVTTNDSGYTLTVGPEQGTSGLDGMTCGVSCEIPNSDLSFTETTGQGNGGTFSGTQAVTIDTVTGLDGNSHTFNYNENWALNIPSSASPGGYSEAFTYTAMGQ